MKKGLLTILCLLSFGFSQDNSNPFECPVDTAIDIQDIWLERAIKGALSLNAMDSSPPLTCGDMKQLTELNINGVDFRISSLSGLEYAVNLQKIVLPKLAPTYEVGHFVKSLEPLKSLNNLKELHIYLGDISDLTPISELENLEKLSLFGHNISDLTPLSNLTGLEVLSLPNNNISDLGPLGQLQSLRALFLSDNHVQSIKPLKSLQNLEALYLSGNPISTPDLTEFASSIRFLSLPSAGISDLSFLEDWPLEGEVSLDFRGNLVHDLQPLVANVSLGEGAVISLRENCLDADPESEDMRILQALTARGVEVLTDRDSNLCAFLNTERPDGLPLNTPIADSKLFRALAVQTGHFELTNVTVSKIDHLELNNDQCSVAWRSKYYEHLNCIQDLSGIENLDSLTELSLDIRMLNDLSILKKLPSLQHLALINGRELVNAGMPIFSFSPICISITDGNLTFDFTPLLNDEVFWQSETEILTNTEISEEVKQLIDTLTSQGVTVKRISDYSECFVHN